MTSVRCLWGLGAGVVSMLLATAVRGAPEKIGHQDVWDALCRNGMITVSMESAADGARREEFRKALAPYSGTPGDVPAVRKILVRMATPEDVATLTACRVRRYKDGTWQLLSEKKIPEYEALEGLSRDEAVKRIAGDQLLLKYMGEWLNYVDLSKDEAYYASHRQKYFDLIKSHLVHRYATGLIGPLLLKGSDGKPLLGLKDFVDESKLNERSLDFLSPPKGKIRRDGNLWSFAGDSFTRKYEFSDWKIEFLFQKRSSWPLIDKKIIEKAGSTCTPMRAAMDGSPDDLGVWLSPALYTVENPSYVDSAALSRFTDAHWANLKNSGCYDVRAAKGGTLDLLDPDCYSVVWGPNPPAEADRNEYYFDPGHQRKDLAELAMPGEAANPNNAWHQYQCHVLVRASGTIRVDGKEYSVGPIFHSDLFYVDMYATEKSIPRTLAELRKNYGKAVTVEVQPPAEDGAGASGTDPGGSSGSEPAPIPPKGMAGPRTIDEPTETATLFSRAGTPDGKSDEPQAFYPRETFPVTLPGDIGGFEFTAKDSTCYYRTGIDTSHLVRYPPGGTTDVPLPDPLTDETLKAYLDRYYTEFAIYYPRVHGHGPWLVKVDSAASGAGSFPYPPTGTVPGTSDTWADVVYRPIRFNGGVPSASSGIITPQGYLQFSVSMAQYGMQVPAGAFPVPVGYQTLHGSCSAGQIVAPADAKLSGYSGNASTGLLPPGSDLPDLNQALDSARDNYCYATMELSAGCCGTFTYKVVDKSVGVGCLPRANCIVTVAEIRSDGNAGHAESQGLFTGVSASTGVSALPGSNLKTVSSHRPSDGYYTENSRQIDLPFRTKLAAAQEYEIAAVGDPAMGPSIKDGRVYYAARQLKMEIRQTSPSNQKLAEYSFMGPPIVGGPYSNMNEDPPIGTVKFAFPQEGTYEIVTTFQDSNNEERVMHSKVEVGPRGYSVDRTGQESQQGTTRTK